MNRINPKGTILTLLIVGMLLSVRVALTQTGGPFHLTWTSADNDRLLSSGGNFQASAGLSRPLSGLQSAGNYQLNGRVPVFGNILPPSPTPCPAQNESPVDESAFIANTLPQHVSPNLAFQIGITIHNLGNTGWCGPSGYSLAVLDDPCGLFGGATSIPLPTDSFVSPGEYFQFISSITAPAGLGPCTAHLQMKRNGAAFGALIEIDTLITEPTNRVEKWMDYE